MDALIVNAGLQAAHSAGLAGPRVNITTVKLGDGTITPDVGMTDIQGTLLYTATTFAFTVINANNIQYEILLDESVGTFTFSEVGLFLDSGELFALGVANIQIFKEQQSLPTTIGNRITIRIQIQLSNITNVLDFTLVTSGIGTQYANNIRLPTFINANTFSLLNDQTSEFHPGRRLKLSQTASPDVFTYIITSVFATGITTITTTETIVDSTIFAVDHSILTAGVSTGLPSTLLTVPRTIPISTSPGKQGEVAYDAGFLYVCIADDIWRRVVLSSF